MFASSLCVVLFLHGNDVLEGDRTTALWVRMKNIFLYKLSLKHQLILFLSGESNTKESTCKCTRHDTYMTYIHDTARYLCMLDIW